MGSSRSGTRALIPPARSCFGGQPAPPDARLWATVKDKLKRFGLFTRLGEDNFFATLGEAVNVYLKRHQVDWKDWEA